MECETLQLIQHDPDVAIVTTAKEKGCDLIVMAALTPDFHFYRTSVTKRAIIQLVALEFIAAQLLRLEAIIGAPDWGQRHLIRQRLFHRSRNCEQTFQLNIRRRKSLCRSSP